MVYIPNRIFEQAQARFQPQDAADSVIDARHRNQLLIHGGDDILANLRIVRIHNHIDTGVDTGCDGFHPVRGNVLASVKVVDVGPVGHCQSVPSELFLRPFGQIFVARVNRYAVDRCGVNHKGQCSCLHAVFKWSEIFLSQIVRGNVCRRPVFTGCGGTVAEIMLDADCYIFEADMVRVMSLSTYSFSHGHL